MVSEWEGKPLFLPDMDNLVREPDRIVSSPDGAVIFAWITPGGIVELEVDGGLLQTVLAALPEVMHGE